MGIEPTYLAWKASVLPLNYTRMVAETVIDVTAVGVTGFEPAASWSQTRRSSQAEPHPVICFVTICNYTQIVLNCQLLFYKKFLDYTVTVECMMHIVRKSAIVGGSYGI